MMKLTVDGISNMIRKVAEYKREFPNEVRQALRQETEVEATECKKRCPVAPDGGTLRASIHVENGPEDRLECYIVAGGPAIPYALAVHEHLSEHSPYSWRVAEREGRPVEWNAGGTGPKFIESTINESARFLAARVAKRIAENRK